MEVYCIGARSKEKKVHLYLSVAFLFSFVATLGESLVLFVTCSCDIIYNKF